MGTSTASASLPVESADELVFLYGHQWRDGLLVGKIDHDGIVGGGLVEGQLVELGGHPAMLAVKGTGSVRGETYRATRGQLEEFDKLMESIVPPGGSGSPHRVRVMVRDVKLNHAAMEAWTWQWEDLAGRYPVISSGDWLNPGLAPLFTFVALSCLVSVPVFALVAPLMMYTSRVKGTPAIHSFVSWTITGLLIAAPLAGLYAAYLAHLRRERLSGCLILIVIGLVLVALMLLQSLADFLL